jgi:hypothetical protein
MSNMSAGETDSSTTPVICHCHVVPGAGCQRPADGPAEVSGVGAEVPGRGALEAGALDAGALDAGVVEAPVIGDEEGAVDGGFVVAGPGSVAAR